MKKNCRFVAMVLASALVLPAVSPLSVLAENDATEVAGETTEEITANVESNTTEESSKEQNEEEEFLEPEIVSTENLETGNVIVAETKDELKQDTVEDSEEKNTQEEQKDQNEIDLDKYELMDARGDKDFNNDGISDLMTKLLCDGEILTKDGKKVFGEASYLDVQKSDDFDSDGLKNGEEVIVENDEYAVLLSDPTKVDSDEDGYNDFDEKSEDRMVYGINGGVVGSVRLVARHDESTKNPTHGHVYIVYTSYVDNLKLSIDDIYGYYVTNEAYREKLQDAAKAAATGEEGAEIVSWRSTVDEITEANAPQRAKATEDIYIVDAEHEPHTPASVTLNRGDYVSIGHYSVDAVATQQVYKDIVNGIYTPEVVDELMKLYSAATGANPDIEYVKAHLPEIAAVVVPKLPELINKSYNAITPGGVCFNREFYNQKFEFDQGPNEIIEHDITLDQTKKMSEFYAVESGKQYQVMPHNCTSVAADAWNTLFGFTTDENGNIVKTQYYVASAIRYLDYRADLPVIVKNSIRIMGKIGVDGYVGPKTYVTGKALEKYEKSTGAAPTTFTTLQMIGTIIKEKGKAIVPTPEVVPTPGVVVNPTYSGNKGNNTGSNMASVNQTETVIPMVQSTVTAQVTPALATVPTVESTPNRIAAHSTSKSVAANDKEVVEDVEESSEDASLEETTVDDEEKDTVSIESEETPLSAKEASKTSFPWPVFIAIAAAILCGIAVYARKRAK